MAKCAPTIICECLTAELAEIIINYPAILKCKPAIPVLMVLIQVLFEEVCLIHAYKTRHVVKVNSSNLEIDIGWYGCLVKLSIANEILDSSGILCGDRTCIGPVAIHIAI